MIMLMQKHGLIFTHTDHGEQIFHQHTEKDIVTMERLM